MSIWRGNQVDFCNAWTGGPAMASQGKSAPIDALRSPSFAGLTGNPVSKALEDIGLPFGP
jgi:hypothetical protein